MVLAVAKSSKAVKVSRAAKLTPEIYCEFVRKHVPTDDTYWLKIQKKAIFVKKIMVESFRRGKEMEIATNLVQASPRITEIYL